MSLQDPSLEQVIINPSDIFHAVMERQISSKSTKFFRDVKKCMGEY